MPTGKSNLSFVPAPATGKTFVFRVVSNTDVRPLGLIRWWSHWRRYVFDPCGNTIFDVSCLLEISKFIHDLMAARNPGSKYQKDFGDEKVCARKSCGHPYYRHFDTYDNMRPVGCKYCGCEGFVARKADK
jgi:hypothetical protein